MYDKDGSGSIELPEMIEIIGTLYEMEGVPKVVKNIDAVLRSKLIKRDFLLDLGFGWRTCQQDFSRT